MMLHKSALVPSETGRRSIDSFRWGGQLKTITYLEMETSYDDAPAMNIFIAQFHIIWSCRSSRRATSLILDAEFTKVQFHACEIVRIIGFQSRELHIAFIKNSSCMDL
jgi:hypothetical protein